MGPEDASCTAVRLGDDGVEMGALVDSAPAKADVDVDAEGEEEEEDEDAATSRARLSSTPMAELIASRCVFPPCVG